MLQEALRPASLAVLLLGIAWPSLIQAQSPEKKPEKKPEKAAPRNRLARETSPYLLQHAHNPVDWYPWGEEALAKAKKENKLIFLSIGYSSCHWCHVMERESFLDPEIAKQMNKNFICIKVDREERPDVDTVYMTSLRVYNRLTRSGRGGGWPLSMFLTPDAEPFFGGTYFPARDGDRGVGVGFLSILQRIQEVWQKDADKIREDAKTISRFTKTELEQARPAAMAKVSRDIVTSAVEALLEQHDDKFGGFSFVESSPQRPKFPEPSNLLLLIGQLRRAPAEAESTQKLRRALVFTLERMSLGGIRDHLAGGFHRYSVDRFWRIPHFEKMLYDNGQLASVYAEAYELTGREDFRRVTQEILEFVRRDLRDPAGGFYSALDAESDGEEGKFYRWDKPEIERILKPDAFRLFADVYGLNGMPNFEEKFYVPQLAQSLREIAQQRGVAEDELEKQLVPLRAQLVEVRGRRPRPLTDTKILTSWNGLMIRGFADAGRLLRDDSYIQTAREAAQFAMTKLKAPDNRLWRSYGQGQARLNGYLDDYAFLVDGLIALHRATGEKRWLESAEQITDQQIRLFWDDKQGGFFFTSSDHEALLARAKEFTDGAEPSGNSVAVDNLIYLARELKKPDYRSKAERTIQSAAMIWVTAPSAVPRLASAVDAYLGE